MNNRLYRSRQDAMISGVCGGLGQYLGVSSLYVRLFFLLLALGGSGLGLLVYILLWIVMPLEGPGREPSLQETVHQGSQEIFNQALAMRDDLRRIMRQPNPQIGVLLGSTLVILGSIYFIRELHLPWLNWLNFNLLGPFLLIVAGFALLFRRAKGD